MKNITLKEDVLENTKPAMPIGSISMQALRSKKGASISTQRRGSTHADVHCESGRDKYWLPERTNYH